jgi:tight adherence protein C
MAFRSSFDWLLLGTMAGCIGYLLPGRWLDRRTAARRQVLNRSLPDFLDLLVSCLEGGLSFEASIQRVTGELAFAHPLLGTELLRVQAEIELGASPDRAFQNFAERTDADMVRNLATVLHQARRFGTRVAAALRTQADVLRTEREFLAEEAAQKAAVKILFPTLFCLFPAIFVVLAGPAAIEIAENFSGERSTMQQSAEDAR